MENLAIKRIKFFASGDNPLALKWEKKIRKWLKEKHPGIKVVNKNPQAVIALGGDGTIMKAAKDCLCFNAVLMGLNLGKVGFLASVRDSGNFLSALEKIFEGDYSISERVTLEISVIRGEKKIFESSALNEAVIINPLGMVSIDAFVENYHLQQIKGTGVLVATPTGSTAFNLSAHGPVVMPSIKGFILLELFDHNIPTPAIILDENQSTAFKIKSFRKRNLLIEKNSKNEVDVMLVIDGDMMCNLAEGDMIKIRRSPNSVKFAELEKNYFLKSLQEKFDFR